MTDIPEMRFTAMAERLARVEHRTDTLERCLPRIGRLEAGVASLTTRIEVVAQDVHGIQGDSHRTVEALQRLQEQHQALNQRISQLFWTGAGAMLAIGLLVSAINVIATVQELPLHYGGHPDERREPVIQPSPLPAPRSACARCAARGGSATTMAATRRCACCLQ